MLPPPITIREASEIMHGVNPASSGDSSYWDRYKYKDTTNGSTRWHNPHATSLINKDAQALLELYGVELLAVADGRAYVQKKFPVTGRLAFSRGYRTHITACNDGPIDAPFEFWQKICRTLLEYAIQHGYKEPGNEQEVIPERR